MRLLAPRRAVSDEGRCAATVSTGTHDTEEDHAPREPVVYPPGQAIACDAASGSGSASSSFWLRRGGSALFVTPLARAPGPPTLPGEPGRPSADGRGPAPTRPARA